MKITSPIFLLIALGSSEVGTGIIATAAPAVSPPMLGKLEANSDAMNLTLARKGEVLTLVDSVTPDQFPGKRIAYYINGQYYGADLSSFHPLPGTRCVITKLALPSTDNPTEYWHIQPLRKAEVVAVIPDSNAATFQKRNPQRNYLPSWYEDKSEYRPTKFAPKFDLIEEKINASYLKRSDATWQDALHRAGLTQIEAEHVEVNSLYDPNQSARYGLPGTNIFAATGKKRAQDLTRDEVRSIAEGFGPFGLLGDQFGEGELWWPMESDQEYWFYERAREIADAPECKWKPVFFGTYGGFGFYIVRGWNSTDGPAAPTSQLFKKYYDDPKLATQSCTYFSRMVNLTDANVSWYPADFGYAGDLYKRVHSIQVMKMGQAQKNPQRRTFLFWWYGIECVDNGLIHNGYNWEHQTTEPPGRSISDGHPIVDLNSAIGMCLIAGFVVGDGVIGWDNNIQFDPDPNTVGRDEKWIAASQNTAIKRAERYGYPTAPLNVMSAQFIASQWYQKCTRTTGSRWQYARYKVDNGPWVEPEKDGSTILFRAEDADHNRQGVAFIRQKGQAVDWVFQNPLWLPDQQHTVTLQLDKHQWSQQVRGNEVVLCNETIVPAKPIKR